MDIKKYLKMEFDKGNDDWKLGLGNASIDHESSSWLAMNLYCKQKAEGLRQKELAR